MFGIGAQEIVIILIVALIVVGPQRLPEVAGQVAKAIRDFRRMSDDLTGEFQRGLALDDNKTPSPLLTDEVITASSTPDQVGSSIAQSLRVETIPVETTAPAPLSSAEASAASDGVGDTAGAVHTALDEDTVISLAPVASRGAPLVGVSALDSTATFVGATYPAKTPPVDYVYEPSAIPEQPLVALDAEPATTGEADAVRAQNGISDAWDAVLSTEATASPVYTEIVAIAAVDESVPDFVGPPASAAPTHEPIDPQAVPTIREKIEAQVAAEAFRERRRIASYQRGRKRE
jgi:Tat protein translocase TatB subunit